MKRILLIICLLTTTYVFAQKVEKDFGEISLEEMEMTSYEKDSEAKAVILYDKGKTIFFDTENGGYDIRFTRYKKIKIFDKTATEHTEFSIPYYVDGYGKTEVIKSIEAITYNYENGSIIKKNVNPENIFEEKISERWFAKKFVFPDVQDGAVLEVKYVLETPFHFNLPDWEFQDAIPTIYSEYEANMIPFYEYVFLVQGITKFNYQHSVEGKIERKWGNVVEVHGQNMGSGIEFKDYIHTYVLKDVPAFKDESFISNKNDYIIKMDFQLAKFHKPYGGVDEIISTWTLLNEALLKHEKFGKYIKASSKFAKKILENELNLEGFSEKKKASKIVNYVKNKFEWNYRNSKYASQTAKSFIGKNAGNAADINLFLIALLNEAGITAQPLILSTRGHGKLPIDYPFDYFTNYVIVLVKTSSPFLADATESLLPYNRLPTRCLNEKGLIVNEKKEVDWVTLGSVKPSLNKNTITLEIDEETNDAKATILAQSTEYEALKLRNSFNDNQENLKEYFKNKVGKVETLKSIGYKRITLPYSINVTSTVETEKLGSNILIKPFLNLAISKNRLTQEKRSYPVDFIYPKNEEFSTTLKIPESFSIADLPENFEVNNELVKIKLTYTSADGFVKADGKYTFKKAIYSPDEYSKIKQHLDDIVEKFNQSILLEAKT